MVEKQSAKLIPPLAVALVLLLGSSAIVPSSASHSNNIHTFVLCTGGTARAEAHGHDNNNGMVEIELEIKYIGAPTGQDSLSSSHEGENAETLREDGVFTGTSARAWIKNSVAEKEEKCASGSEVGVEG